MYSHLFKKLYILNFGKRDSLLLPSYLCACMFVTIECILTKSTAIFQNIHIPSVPIASSDFPKAGS